MQFKNIIGQADIKTLLARQVAEDRMPHAQLFLGSSGSGKLALAIAFAQYVLCENRSEEDSCGKCRNCIRISKYMHPDVHYSYPTVGSKAVSTTYIKEWAEALQENPYMSINHWLKKLGADNKQGNITKDECVNIIKKLSLKTFESRYKIMIIWLPEYLGKEGNRLLKLIEEPPENTLFVLVAENQELILNTILSRCQIVKINPLSDEEIADKLQLHGLDEENAINVARLANGDYNEALNLLENTENDNAQLFLKWFRICYKGNGKELVDWVSSFAKIGRENQKHFLNYAQHFLREFLVLKMTGNTEQVRLQKQEKNTAINMTKVLGFEQVERLSTLFNEVTYYVERNANPKILFLDTSIRVHKILRLKT